jgi:hypothetical protein
MIPRSTRRGPLYVASPWQYLAEVKDLLVRKFREVFSTGGIYVNYRAFLRAVKAIEHGIGPEDVQVMTLRFIPVP